MDILKRGSESSLKGIGVLHIMWAGMLSTWILNFNDINIK